MYNLRRGRWIGLREGMGEEREKQGPEELILVSDGADERDGRVSRSHSSIE